LVIEGTKGKVRRRKSFYFNGREFKTKLGQRDDASARRCSNN
jgi:hypothetical protein